PASPTAPDGTDVRGELRRGTCKRESPPVRYAKPGANPPKATVQRLPVWAAITPSAPRPVNSPTSSRSVPSYRTSSVTSSTSMSSPDTGAVVVTHLCTTCRPVSDGSKHTSSVRAAGTRSTTPRGRSRSSARKWARTSSRESNSASSALSPARRILMGGPRGVGRSHERPDVDLLGVEEAAHGDGHRRGVGGVAVDAHRLRVHADVAAVDRGDHPLGDHAQDPLGDLVRIVQYRTGFAPGDERPLGGVGAVGERLGDHPQSGPFGLLEKDGVG